MRSGENFADGRSAVEAYSKQLEGYEGNIVVTAEEMEEASNSLRPHRSFATRRHGLFSQGGGRSSTPDERSVAATLELGKRRCCSVSTI